MRRAKKNEQIAAPFILVGNKSDKFSEREVSKDEGMALARDLGCRFLETSAKTAQNVEECFVSVIRDLRRLKDKEATLSLPAKKEKFWSKCIIF
jgi:GTPase KRas protein